MSYLSDIGLNFDIGDWIIYSDINWANMGLIWNTIVQLRICRKYLWLFSSINAVWAPISFATFFFKFCFEFAESFWIWNLSCAMGHCGEPTFLANTRNLKLGWCRPWLLLFIYIQLYHHSLFKGLGKLIKNCCILPCSGNCLALGPIAHNQILHYGA